MYLPIYLDFRLHRYISRIFTECSVQPPSLPILRLPEIMQILCHYTFFYLLCSVLSGTQTIFFMFMHVYIISLCDGNLFFVNNNCKK